MEMLKKLAGTTWRANHGILKKIKNRKREARNNILCNRMGNITAKTNPNKLDKIQNWAENHNKSIKNNINKRIGELNTNISPRRPDGMENTTISEKFKWLKEHPMYT